MLMVGALGMRARPGLAQRAREVTVLPSADEAPYRQAVEAIKAGLPGWSIRVLDPSDPLANVSGLLVALGQKALRQVAGRGYGGTVLAVLITRSSYQDVLKALPSEARQRWSAIVLDQPWSRQLALTRLLLPKSARLGVLVTEDGEDVLPEIRPVAAAQGFALEARRVKDERQLFADLRQLLPGVDALWALPDRGVINRNTLEGFLISAYRAHVPVIGYSRAMVDAGALGAVYSTPEDAGREIAALLLNAPEEGGGPTAEGYPQLFSVKLNGSVARSLGLPVTDEQSVLRQLYREPRS
jgi:hypothetical protein